MQSKVHYFVTSDGILVINGKRCWFVGRNSLSGVTVLALYLTGGNNRGQAVAPLQIDFIKEMSGAEVKSGGAERLHLNDDD